MVDSVTRQASRYPRVKLLNPQPEADMPWEAGGEVMRNDIDKALSDGRLARNEGRPLDAASHYEQAATLARSVNDHHALAIALRHVADIVRDSGDAKRAFEASREAVSLYRGLGATPLELANALRVNALALRAACEDDKALPLWIEARRLYHSVNVLAGVEECDRYLEDLRIATDSRLDAERELRLHAEPLQKHLQYSERKERRALGQMMVKQLLMDEGALRIRMHQEGDHATPKVHLSYGSGFHAVSLQVSPAKVLEGDAGRVPKWLIGEALAWVTQHEAMLMRIWAKLQADGDPEPLIVELRGYDA